MPTAPRIRPDSRRFLTMKEAAAYLQVDYQTMRKYVRGENAPKHLQITARCIRFPYDDFMAWVESKARGGNGV